MFAPRSRGFPPDSAGRGGGLVATRACLLQSAGDGGPLSGARPARGELSRGRRARQRKGTGSRFPDRDGGACESSSSSLHGGGAGRPHHGDVNEPRDVVGSSGEGSLPSLTVHRSPVSLQHVKNAGDWRAVARKAPTALESTRSEIGLNGWQSALVFRASGALPPTLENLGEVAPAHGLHGSWVGSLPTRPYS